MKRIGTITTSIGFIFLGVFLIIKNMNYDLAMEILKWWPLIFIGLGVEIIFFGIKRKEETKIKFNYVIILVILMLVITNGYYYMKNNFGYFIKEGIRNGGINFEIENSKRIKSSKQLPSIGREIYLEVNNADIDINNTEDKKINIKSDIYVDKRSKINKYDIKEEKNDNVYTVNFKNDYVRRAKINIDVPKGYIIRVQGNNVDVESDDYYGDIGVDANNGKVYMEGNILKSDIKLLNGVIDIDTDKFEEMKLYSNNGKIDVNTLEKDIKIDVGIKHGVCKINDYTKANSSISKTIGNGTKTMSIDLKNGVINVDTEE